MVNDYDLLFRLSKKFNIASLNRTLVCSRQHDNNLSFQKIVKGQIELIKLKMDILNSVKDINTKIKIYQSIIITLFRITYHSLRNFFK